MADSNILVVTEPGTALAKELGTGFGIGIQRYQYAALEKGLARTMRLAPSLGSAAREILDIVRRGDELCVLKIGRDVDFNTKPATVRSCDSTVLLAFLCGLLLGGDYESFEQTVLLLPDRGINPSITETNIGFCMEIFGEAVTFALANLN